MAFNIFKKKGKEENKEEVQSSPKVDHTAPLIENEFLCNVCGKVIENTPRFMKFQGRRMVFHKNCLNGLKNGRIKL